MNFFGQEFLVQDIINLAAIIFVIIAILKVEKLIFPKQVTDKEIGDYVDYLRENGRMWDFHYTALKKEVLHTRKKIKSIVIVIDVILLMVLSVLAECVFGLFLSNFIVISICIVALIVYALFKIIPDR